MGSAPAGPASTGAASRRVRVQAGPALARALAVSLAALALVAGTGCQATQAADGDAAIVGGNPVGTSASAATGGDDQGRGGSGPRIAVVGDSTAERLAPAIASWGTASSEIVFVGNAARLGCPMGRGGTMRTAADVTGAVNADCDWEATATTGLDGVARPTYADVASHWDPDLVIVFNGVWDVADRRIPGEDTWRHAGDPVYDQWLVGELLAANDELSANGAHVVWLTLSPWEGATRHPPERLYAPAADPARVVAYNELLDRVVAARPDSASIVDLAGWLDETGEDVRLRPDGAHLDPATAVEVVERFLGATLLSTWADAVAR